MTAHCDCARAERGGEWGRGRRPTLAPSVASFGRRPEAVQTGNSAAEIENRDRIILVYLSKHVGIMRRAGNTQDHPPISFPLYVEGRKRDIMP